ncbi:egl nine 1 [Gracilaria domingensis]|nr:egl nine 1 [Gracilaria domingensis]
MAAVPCYQLAVGRQDLFTTEYTYVAVPDNVPQPEMMRLMVRDGAPMPTPRFTGNVLALEQLLERIQEQPQDIIVETQDLNVANAFKHTSRGEVEIPEHDDDLRRLFRLLENPIVQRHFVIRPMQPFSRLNIHPGALGARERLDAVYNHSFVMYPCPEESGEDAFEVRFGSPRSDRLSYERFLDWGEKELDCYIERAVVLGHADRLTVKRLVEEDPLAFWALLLRYRKYFPRLARVSSDQTWKKELMVEARAANRLGTGEADEHGIMHEGRAIPAFSTLLDMLTIDNRQDHAETGFIAAMNIAMKMGKKMPGSAIERERVGITMEMSENMRSSNVARVVYLAQQNGEMMRNAGGDVDARRRAETMFSERLGELLGDDMAEAREEGHMRLVGQCQLCSHCGKREQQPGLLLRCGRCRVARYCDRSCQRGDWGAHKRDCGKNPDVRPEPSAVRAVVFPGDPAVKPYPTWIRGRTYDDHRRYVATSVLKCELSELKRTAAALGVAEGDGDRDGKIVMLHSGSGRVNARACAVAERAMLPTLQMTVFSVGHLAKVRGNAVLVKVRRGARGCHQQSMCDFSMQNYRDRWGVFSYLGAEDEDGTSRDTGADDERKSIGFAVPIHTSPERVVAVTTMMRDAAMMRTG